MNKFEGTIKKYPLTSAIISGVIIVNIIGAIFSGADNVINGLLIQDGLCIQDNYGCLIKFYILSALTLICLAFLSDNIFLIWLKHVKLEVIPYPDVNLYKKIGIEINNSTSLKFTNVKVMLDEDNGLIWIPLNNQSSQINIPKNNRTFINWQGLGESYTILPKHKAYLEIAEINDNHEIVWLLNNSFTLHNEKYYKKKNKDNIASQFKLNLIIEMFHRTIKYQEYHALVLYRRREKMDYVISGSEVFPVDEPATITTIDIKER